MFTCVYAHIPKEWCMKAIFPSSIVFALGVICRPYRALLNVITTTKTVCTLCTICKMCTACTVCPIRTICTI